MCKFQIGERVNIISGLKKGSSGVITESHIGYADKMEYHVILDGGKAGQVYFEENLEIETVLDKEENNGSDYISEDNAVTNIKEPEFKVGDVVIDAYAESCPVYIIKESIYTPEGYSYEVITFGGSPDESTIITENTTDLVFEYHDTNWEEYFTEGTRQRSLPAWRGELYNFFMFFDDYSDVSLEPEAAVNEHEMEEFKDHTVPPIRIWHILRSHSIFARVNDVIKSMENKKIIAEAIGIDVVDVKRFSNNFNRKIISRNTTNTTYGKKLENLVIPKFTNEEEIFANLIDKLDTSNKGIKDHYPYRLTNLQIMDAIREAYGNARKVSSKEIDVEDDPTYEDPDARFIGKQEYEGYSKKYDLVIRFLYNFDYNFIETAYPLRMNNNIKKH